jgi:hypothetical protein
VCSAVVCEDGCQDADGKHSSFMKERAAKTDFAGKKTTEWLKDLSAEWKALSDTEKKVCKIV